MILHNNADRFDPPGNRKPPVPAETLNTASVDIERKSFVFQLQENAKGRLLRIIEEAHGRKNAIVIPATGLEDFKRALDSVLSPEE